jgi:hypothetical protein
VLLLDGPFSAFVLQPLLNIIMKISMAAALVLLAAGVRGATLPDRKLTGVCLLCCCSCAQAHMPLSADG